LIDSIDRSSINMMLLPTVKGLYLGNGVFAGKMTQDFRDFQEMVSKLSLSDNQTILRALFADFAQEGTMEIRTAIRL
jgi:hypothetical protein